VQKGRKIPFAARGERNGAAKLSDADVICIRTSVMSRKEAANQYRVSLSTITRIRNRRKWAHL
jgi:hypothetical protein